MNKIKNMAEDFVKSMAEIHPDFEEITVSCDDTGSRTFLWFATPEDGDLIYSSVYMDKAEGSEDGDLVYSSVYMDRTRDSITRIMFTGLLYDHLEEYRNVFLEKTENLIKSMEEESGAPLEYLNAGMQGAFTVNFKNSAVIPQEIRDIFFDMEAQISGNTDNFILRSVLYDVYRDFKAEIEKYEDDGELYSAEIIDADDMNPKLREYLKSNLKGFEGVCLLSDTENIRIINYITEGTE